MLPVVCMYALFALNLVMVKAGLGYIHPIFLQGIRLFIAGNLLLVYLYFFKPTTLNIGKKDILSFVQAGFFLMYISFVLGIMSLDDFSSANQSSLLNLSPFLAALLSYVYFAERLTKYKWIGLVIGVFGFIPLILLSSVDPANKATFLSIPGMQATGSIFGYTYGLVLVRQLVKDKGYSPLLINGITMALGGVLALCTSFFLETWYIESFSLLFEPFLFGLIIVVLCTDMLRYNMYAMLLRRYTVTFMSFAGFMYPLFAALFGWLFLKESISKYFLISTSIVSIGLYVFYLEELRK